MIPSTFFPVLKALTTLDVVASIIVNPIILPSLINLPSRITITFIFIMAILTTRNLSWIGLILSAYAVYVEYKVEHLSPDEEFSALCDVPALGASCR